MSASSPSIMPRLISSGTAGADATPKSLVSGSPPSTETWADTMRRPLTADSSGSSASWAAMSVVIRREGLGRDDVIGGDAAIDGPGERRPE